jgi:flavonol-3-O-L-rhamnoside-7-O-glucosyltransferase
VITSKNLYDKVADEHEPIPLPGFPHPLAISKNQSPFNVSLNEKFRDMIREEESQARGVIVNTFQELESLYLDSFKNAIRKEVWALGPMGLYNRDMKKLNSRGNKASIDIDRCMLWLDGMRDGSVIYLSFGSLACSIPLQLIELGLGLEASEKPFIWVLKTGDRTSEFEQWMLQERFEERTKDRGVIIRGWAPQMAILSHNAIGGFMTHCGWNSIIEGISSGVPMITWPHFADQFVNEMLVVDVLKIGIRIGVTSSTTWGSEKGDEVKVKREDVERKILELINEEGEGMERRVKAIDLGRKARKAMKGGGSSCQNIVLLIHEIRQQMRVADVEKESGTTSVRVAQLN